jgi:hypothetical protein
MIDTLSGAHLADFAAIEPIYVDGIAGVFNLGPNFAIDAKAMSKANQDLARDCESGSGLQDSN